MGINSFLSRAFPVVVVLALFVGLGVTPVGAAAPENHVYIGDTTIDVGDVVSGNVIVLRGDLVVRGTIDGNVRQLGRGFVHVDGGTVTGSIYEWGRGTVQVFNHGTVAGDIVERGNNGRDAIGVDVTTGGVVKGNIYEYGSGNVDVATDGADPGRVEGSIFERGIGKVSVYDFCEVNGDIEERGRGDVIIEELAKVDGDIREFGPGEIFDNR